jgi:hypothetical protein
LRPFALSWTKLGALARGAVSWNERERSTSNTFERTIVVVAKPTLVGFIPSPDDWFVAVPNENILKRLSVFSSGRPSRRRQKKAAPQGDRFCRCLPKTISANPAEVPSLGTVPKGVIPIC